MLKCSNVVGVINLTLGFDNQVYNMKFYIVEIKCKNIIGLESAVNLDWLKNVNLISVNKLVEKYIDVFNGLGLLQSKCNLKIRDDVSHIVDPPRKIPFKLHDKLKN